MVLLRRGRGRSADRQRQSHGLSEKDEKKRRGACRVPVQLNKQSLREEIFSTNEIEGVRSSRKEIKQAIENQLSKDKRNRFYSIAGKYIKLSKKESIPFQTCENLRNFYDNFVADEIKAENPQNLPDGKLFRKAGVSVRTPTQKVLHEGLFPEKKIIQAMTDALGLLHDETIPSLIRISIFHYLFGYIHPFYDGNGRTSRFIASYYLSQELQNIVGLRLSITVKQRKKDYYQIFDETNSDINRGDLTPFITQFLNFILVTIQGLQKTLQEKLQQLSKYDTALKKLLKDKGLEDDLLHRICYVLLQAAMFSSDGATIREIQDAVEKARGTVDNRISKIPSEWILKDTSPRQHRYKFNVLALRSQL